MGIKSVALFFLKILFTVFIIWIVFSYFNIDELNWRDISPAAIFYCFALWFANIGTQLLRWHFLLRAANSEVKLGITVRSFFGSATLGLFTPGRIGELGRALFIQNISWKKVSFLAIIERFFTLLSLLFWAGIAAVFLDSKSQIFRDYFPDSTYIILAVFVLIFALILLMKMNPKLTEKLHFYFSKSRSLLKIKSVLVLLSISLLFVAIFIIQTAIILNSLTDISFVSALSVAALVHFFKSILPFTIGDLGTREGIAAALMQHVAANPDAGVLAALVIFFINVVLPAVIGIPFIFKMKLLKK
ncbi:MAG: UPF0104 family protein [Calditrichaeota bacterium]|nr:MAG: UPF0104 family protein [Calditrichota bacterium]